MTDVFWDTMLFIYLLEGNTQWVGRVEALLARSRARQERLFTSNLALGELQVGRKGALQSHATSIRGIVDAMGFTYLEFGLGAVDRFSRLRASHRVGIADAIHLACAAHHGVDIFITNDTELPKLHVPGIKFISGLATPII